MNTTLVLHTWLDDAQHFARCVRWVKHHQTLYPDLPILFIDNGSSGQSMTRFADAVGQHTMVSFPNIMRDGLLGYGYTWRAFYEFGRLLETCDRLIFMESDFFVASLRMRDWTLEQTGLATVYCAKYGFPESALMVLTRGCAEYERFVAEMPWEARVGTLIETALPFTNVAHEFVGDRYEDCAPPMGCDFAAQVRPEDTIPWSS